MKKILLLFTVSAALYSCTSEKGELPGPVSECMQDSTIDVVTVFIFDNGYNPSPVEIVEGDTILWQNNGVVVHTVTCDGTGGSQKPVGAPSFDSGAGTPIAAGGTYKTSLSVPGTYTYICLYHTGMTGTIVVKPRCQ